MTVTPKNVSHKLGYAKAETLENTTLSTTFLQLVGHNQQATAMSKELKRLLSVCVIIVVGFKAMSSIVHSKFVWT